MSAAGFPNGTDFDFYWLNDNTFGALYNNIVQLYQAMFNDAGLKGSLKGEPFNQWVDNRVHRYFYQETLSGSRTATAVRTHGGASVPDGGNAYLVDAALPGRRLPRHDAGRKDAHKGDPKLNDMSEKIGLEFDRKKQVEMVHDVIRYATQQSYYIPQASSAKKYQLYWPVISGVNVLTSPPDFTNWADNYLDYWLIRARPRLRRRDSFQD
jgi:ABC-type transport system substrate-binding protein